MMIDMDSKSFLKSKKNNNVYHLFDDKIVVQTSHGEKEIPLPVDPTSFKYYTDFYYMFYEGDKLFAVVQTRSFSDMRFEVDEDTLELKGKPIPTR